MQHHAAFHLGLHCLPEYLLRFFKSGVDLNINVIISALFATFHDILITKLKFLWAHQAFRFMVGPGYCPMISKYGRSLSKAVCPMDPFFLVVKKSHFNKTIQHTGSLQTPQNRKYM